MIAEAPRPVKTTPYYYVAAAQQPRAGLLGRLRVVSKGFGGVRR
jgi:hypothetical protein